MIAIVSDWTLERVAVLVGEIAGVTLNPHAVRVV
jgi:hypothetical protein